MNQVLREEKKFLLSLPEFIRLSHRLSHVMQEDPHNGVHGYSLDYVKIDRSLLLNAAQPRGRKLLEGLVALGHSLGLRVLCEGVETQEQLAAALAAGCDFIQGFYFSRVLPEREAERYLREHIHIQQ